MVQRAKQKKPIPGNTIAPTEAKAKEPINGITCPVAKATANKATTKNVQKGKIHDGGRTAHSVHSAKISHAKQTVKAQQAKVASMPEKQITARSTATTKTINPKKTVPAKWNKLSIKNINCKNANRDMTLHALFHP